MKIEEKKHIIIIMAMFGVVLYILEIYTKEDLNGYGKWIAFILLLIAGGTFYYFYLRKVPIKSTSPPPPLQIKTSKNIEEEFRRLK